eukprot:sb/3469250/
MERFCELNLKFPTKPEKQDEFVYLCGKMGYRTIAFNVTVDADKVFIKNQLKVDLPELRVTENPTNMRILRRLTIVVSDSNHIRAFNSPIVSNIACTNSLIRMSIALCTALLQTALSNQEPTDTSKHPIRTRYLGHVTGCQPIRDQYFLIRSVPLANPLPGHFLLFSLLNLGVSPRNSVTFVYPLCVRHKNSEFHKISFFPCPGGYRRHPPGCHFVLQRHSRVRIRKRHFGILTSN